MGRKHDNSAIVAMAVLLATLLAMAALSLLMAL